MDARTQKAMQIAATMPLKRDASGWIVPSQTGTGTYRVVPAPTTNYRVARGPQTIATFGNAVLSNEPYALTEKGREFVNHWLTADPLR